MEVYIKLRRRISSGFQINTALAFYLTFAWLEEDLRDSNPFSEG